MQLTTVVLLTFAVLLGVLAVLGYVLVNLRGQQRRIVKRIEAIARSNGPLGPLDNAVLVPAFALPSLKGERVSLGELMAPARALVLIFTDPRCGPCYDLLPDIGGWQRDHGDRLTIAVISGGASESNIAMTAEYGIAADSVLLQEDLELVRAFGVESAPAAVLVRPGGVIGGKPAYGAPEVRQLVAATLGLALTASPSSAIQAARRGDIAPWFHRPDLFGRPFDLASLRGEEILLLFWSPGCSHCQEILPQIHAWDARTTGPRLVVISRGPVALNQEVGLRAPVILDDDQTIARSFDVTGTPAAVLIDRNGFIATRVARGAKATRALGEHVMTAPPALAVASAPSSHGNANLPGQVSGGQRRTT